MTEADPTVKYSTGVCGAFYLGALDKVKLRESDMRVTISQHSTSWPDYHLIVSISLSTLSPQWPDDHVKMSGACESPA